MRGRPRTCRVPFWTPLWCKLVFFPMWGQLGFEPSCVLNQSRKAQARPRAVQRGLALKLLRFLFGLASRLVCLQALAGAAEALRVQSRQATTNGLRHCLHEPTFVTAEHKLESFRSLQGYHSQNHSCKLLQPCAPPSSQQSAQQPARYDRYAAQ